MGTGVHLERIRLGTRFKGIAASRFRKLERGGGVSKMCFCCGKDGKKKNLYLTESEASIVAEERRIATGITMHVYRCPYGDGWHITSNQRQW
jgi:hypothetical protein